MHIKSTRLAASVTLHVTIQRIYYLVITDRSFNTCTVSIMRLSVQGRNIDYGWTMDNIKHYDSTIANDY